MNRNSLEEFRAQVKALKVPDEMAKKVEELMERGIPIIEVTGQLESRKGYLEATMHLKCSANEFYYLNKYDLALSSAKAAEKGKDYFILSQDDKGKPQFKRFESPIAAIENFKKRTGDAELAIGIPDRENLDYRQTLATMKDGKVDYVVKEFQVPFKIDPIRNTVFVNRGTGLNMKQSANMLQGGSAYRDDLVSRQGANYKAWNNYLLNEPRDNYGNLKIKQYSEGYGFDLKTQLDNYSIKEMGKPETAEKLIAELKDGGRPLVNVVNGEGESMILRMQAMPRFGNLNFYNQYGKPENREQFQKLTKEEAMGKENNFSKKLNKSKDAVKDQEMSM
ncbi:hypothetical protein SAMN05421820_11146 [Pedobacter steynii]|uniref:Uncharacterized protein n=1 Tax=Pedobacter steynii TaxID=430522 RepID=A0A1H0G5M7_9SPHI|nr:hypothetical protein [Pedobacter steynii]NQX42326.1 hypothetical protein [Pedobacter steynii]SDO02049.1 hypothetical protein SAMN05421820_11146 [Pedobacter steynii]